MYLYAMLFFYYLNCVHEELESILWESPGSLLEFMNACLLGFYVPSALGFKSAD